MAETTELYDPKKFIVIKGARMHNLKNVDLAIPRNRFVVITGLSGSGKSSLAFDTLFAEGQRRYVESLSSYARQFLGKIEKPQVDYIKGISPAVAIEQKVNTRNPRSTVGTSTEIYDYLKLLFARIGKTFSPVSGELVKRHTVSNVVDAVMNFPSGTKIFLLAPVHQNREKTLKEQVGLLLQQGFTRILYDGEMVRLNEINVSKLSPKKEIMIVIDRFAVNANDEELSSRIADSVQTAFFEGEGDCVVEIIPEEVEADYKKNTSAESGSNQRKSGETGKTKKKTTGQQPTANRQLFSNRFEADGILFEEPNVHFFSFNNAVGACKTCEGFGSVIGIDPDLVVPNKNLSVFEEAIACWKGEKMGEWKEKLLMNAYKFNFPIHKPYCDLSTAQKELLWTGNKYFDGLNSFFLFLEEQSYKIQYRVMLSRYRGKTTCPDCNGTRLRKDANYVKVAGKSISDIVLMQVKDALQFFLSVKLPEYETKVAKRLLTEITNRLRFLTDVGLGYLSLNRLSSTLSGGESQRINLATSLGSSLVGSMYILDEPSIGLHPRDTGRLIRVLHALRDIGNTVIVVEHDEEIMRSSDAMVDMGPMAGTLGGHVVFSGTHNDLLKAESLTAKYLTKRENIPVPSSRRKWKYFMEITGATENNLKNLNVKFPLDVMTVITGVSGSGKSTLVKRILYPALQKSFGGFGGEQTGQHAALKGDYHHIAAVEFIDQNPIGKSSRSNPVTYVKAYDEIRALYADQALAKLRGYKPSHFSFNVDGGRCEICEGEGEVIVEMQFMADVHLQCEACHGKRFKDETLEILYNEKNIYDILEMTIDDAVIFFNDARPPARAARPDEPFGRGTDGDDTVGRGTKPGEKIVSKLKPLQDTGLGYVHLGQSSSTLSGGEAQRIKLASFLGMGQHQPPTLFIFDEPTTGLHFHDIKKLLDAFSALIEQGHSIIIIEHNLEVIKCADWIIDLGPEGGDEGGQVMFEGTPEEMVKSKSSLTGKYLKEKLEI
ncbi:MAG: excinuclease ABC subunit UvrA [Bacteroidetes bacterium]|nr:excinuclease ABC subunit UvrA [Bacteroidota bacterium]